ncbi:MAG: hypothetical protein NTX88_06510 [Candidatus Atribacteria bacterium]|nr:hypothetical protein [Candidatus Atribacteria bacterium]
MIGIDFILSRMSLNKEILGSGLAFSLSLLTIRLIFEEQAFSWLVV